MQKQHKKVQFIPQKELHYQSKLEKLLAQPDIFDTLRKLESGEIKSYD